MLLKHLYDYALSKKLLDDLAFKPRTPVRWIIPLDPNGKLIGSGVIETFGGDNDIRNNRGKLYDVPKTSRPTNSGTVSDFLVDDVGAVFALRTKFDKDKASGNIKEEEQSVIDKRRAKNVDFWEQIRAAWDVTRDDDLNAIIKFKVSLADKNPPFLRLKDDGSTWMVITQSEEEKKLGSDFFSFQVDGRIVFTKDSIKTYWKQAVTEEIAENEESAQKGVCLITGQNNVSLARTHIPMITGLPKTHKNDQIKSRGIVGFQSDSFCSYGFSRSYNAPTSVMASKAYLKAFQYLISHEDHWLPIGKLWFCFWAKSNDAVSSLFARILKKPDPRTIRNFLISPWEGLSQLPPSDEKFYTFSFTASGPRIVIKTWSEAPLENVALCFKHWFEDLAIIAPYQEGQDSDDRTPLAIRQLVNTTLPLKRESGRFIADVEKLHPEVPSQLYRAALEGSAPSISLIHHILNQFRSRLLGDENYKLIYDQSRFALLKLILNRNRKETDMEIKTSLTADTNDPAYNCGRLLSVLSETQKKAQGYPKGFSGVAERYFGMASVSPSTVFPLLLRLNRHHLDKIRKSGGNAYEEVAIRNIVAKFKPAGDAMPPVFPRILDLQAQGRFAIGFYQQQAEDANVRIAHNILNYLEETDATAHTEALTLQKDDPQAFDEKVNQHYGSASFKEWGNKRKKKKLLSSSDAPELFDNE